MERLSARRAAVALGAGFTAVTLVVASFGLLRDESGPGDSLGNLVLALGFGGVGLLLLARVPANPVAWILLVTGVGQAVAPALGALGLPGEGWVASWAWAPGVYGTLALLPQVFPDGPMPGWWRRGAWATLACITAATLAYAVPGDAAATLALVSEFGVGAGALLALASLVVRWRRHPGLQRQQLKWLLLATVALLAAYAVADALPERVADAVFVAVPLLLPGAVALAVLRHGLYEIDLILHRALVYGALSLLVLAAYVAGVALFGRSSGVEAGPALVTVLAVALLFDPLRRRLQRSVDRFVYGRRDDPLHVLREVGARLDAAGPPEVVLPAVARTIAESLRLAHVGFAVRLGDAEVEAASVGTPVGRTREFPLTWHDEPVGTLVASPRTAAEQLTRADVRLLEGVAAHAGAVARSWQLAQELRRSHERLAAIRDSERERLRSDLHDGLGPLLAGVELGLGGVSRMLPPGDGAQPVVTRIGDQVASAMAEVRRLIDDLGPEALDGRGLVAALRDHTDAVRAANGPSLRVDVVAAHRWPALAAETEIAAYRIAMEALTNVLHHADAHACTIRLDAAGDCLRLDVLDDGRGIGGSRWGVGLTSMSRRAQALGGCVTLTEPADGGTWLRAELPLRVAGTAEVGP